MLDYCWTYWQALRTYDPRSQSEWLPPGRLLGSSGTLLARSSRPPGSSPSHLSPIPPNNQAPFSQPTLHPTPNPPIPLQPSRHQSQPPSCSPGIQIIITPPEHTNHCTPHSNPPFPSRRQRLGSTRRVAGWRRPNRLNWLEVRRAPKKEVSLDLVGT